MVVPAWQRGRSCTPESVAVWQRGTLRRAGAMPATAPSAAAAAAYGFDSIRSVSTAAAPRCAERNYHGGQGKRVRMPCHGCAAVPMESSVPRASCTGTPWFVLASIHRLVLPLQVASRNRPNVHHGVRRCRSLDWGAGYIHPDGRRATTRSNGQLTMFSR